MIRLFPLRSLWTRCVLAVDHLAAQITALAEPHSTHLLVRVPAKAHPRNDKMHGQMRHTQMHQRTDRRT